VDRGPKGIADKPLFGHVKRAAQAPAGGVEEVGGAILGRRRDVANLILLAAALGGAQARLILRLGLVLAPRQ